MRWFSCCALATLLSSAGWAQEPEAPAAVPEAVPAPLIDVQTWQSPERGPLQSDRAFPNFIGFISNPQEAFDPRALTQAWPVFASAWMDAFPPLPNGDFQVYGMGLSLAVTERLCVGLGKGGYAVSRFGDGNRDGWLNLGGFVQYTLIRDVPDQFLLTSGLQWQAPSGEARIFQGHGPAYLAPYLTAGKEVGLAHLLATVGYQFPAGPGHDTVDAFFGTIHVDRRTFGWLYPVVEFNWAYLTSRVDLALPTRRGLIDLGTIKAAGNIVTVAPGVNAVLIPDRLELGIVYETPMLSDHNLHMNQVLVKMIMRF